MFVAHSCLTVCDSTDCSPPVSSVHGIAQATILEWVAISFSRGSFQPRSPALQADSLPSEPPRKPYQFGPVKTKKSISRARHTTLIFQQCRNIALSIKIQAAQSHTKPTDIPKLPIGHFIALQTEEIQLHRPEH